MAELKDAPAEEIPSTEGLPLCPSCLSPHSELADFCPECGCPVSSFSMVGPIEQIHGQGWIARRLLHRRIPGWMLAAIWLGCGAFLIPVLYDLYHDLRGGIRLEQVPMMAAGSGLVIFICFGILIRFTLAYFRQGPPPVPAPEPD